MRLSIDRSKKYQSFAGFGASGAWWAQIVGGWTKPGASGMPVLDEIANLLYGKTGGIGMRTYRYNLGAGSADSGKGSYGDPARRTHSLTDETGAIDLSRDKNAVDMLRACVKAGAEEAVVFVNSPPESLTKNGMAHLSKHRVFRTNLSRKNIPAFADYVLKAADALKKEGIPVRDISPVNEPFWVWNGGQEGCHYSPRQASRVLRCFAKKLNDCPALANVRLAGMENGDIRWRNKSYTRALLRYQEVRERVAGIDLHSYFLPMPPFMPLKLLNDRPAFLRRYRKWLDRRFPGVPVRMSEWCHMQGGRDAGMDSALQTAKVIWEDLTLLNVSAWQHWIACSLYDYCDGLLYLDVENESYTLTKRWAVTGNFSKYIPTGAVRVEVVADAPDVKAVSFTGDGKTVTVLIHSGKTPETLTLSAPTLVSVTDETRDMEETRSDAGDTLTVPPRSVVTIVTEDR